jgi:arginine decarboxylase
MGSHHNLFGHPNEAHVVIDTDGRFHITKLLPGSRISDMIQFARYDVSQLVESFRKQVQAQVQAGKLAADEGEHLVAEYELGASRGTYLD